MDRRPQPACWSWGRSVPAGEARSACPCRSIPFERPFLPFVDKPDGEHAEEDHHRPETEPADIPERYRPGKQESDFEIEDDEQDRHQVEPDVEFHTRVVKRIE